MGVQDEVDQFGVSFRQGHAVKVNPRLGLKLAARHLAVCLCVHLQRRLAQGFGWFRGKIAALGRPCLLTQGKQRQTGPSRVQGRGSGRGVCLGWAGL